VPHWPRHQRAIHLLARRLHTCRRPHERSLMRNSIKLGLTALMATMLLASALSTASARNLSISVVDWRVNWSRLEFSSSIVTVRCQVSLEGSFHSRVIPKTQRLLIGSITRISVFEERCTGGRVRPEKPPPWHLTYEGFTGRLPNIETLRLLIQRFQFAIIAAGITCKYGTSTDNITGDAAFNAVAEITTFTPTAGRNIANLLEGGGLCPATGTLTSTPPDGGVNLLTDNTKVRVTLI